MLMAEKPEPVEEKAAEGGSVNRGKTPELIKKIVINCTGDSFVGWLFILVNSYKSALLSSYDLSLCVLSSYDFMLLRCCRFYKIIVLSDILFFAK